MRALGGTFVSVVALAASGCITNHDLLAKRSGADGSGGATALGSGGTPATTQVDGAAEAADGSDTGADADALVAPALPRTLTLLHGVIDSPWIGFCFAIVHDGKAAPVAGAILPPGGLDYGHSAVLTSIPGVALGTDDLLPLVVAAKSSDVVLGLDCAAIVARAKALVPGPEPAVPPLADAASPPDATTSVDGSMAVDASARDAATTPLDARPPPDATPPPGPKPRAIAAIRVAALPILPGVALSAAKSYLLLAGGCLGGPGVTDPSEMSVCGEGYSSITPTLMETVVALSRVVESGRVGLAFLDGTPALRAVDLTLDPGFGTPLALVSNVVTGALRPSPPTTAFSVSDLGTSNASSAIWLNADGSTSPIYDGPWPVTLHAGGIDALENAHGYTLVVVGPYPGFAKRNWWNDPLVTVVRNDP